MNCFSSFYGCTSSYHIFKTLFSFSGFGFWILDFKHNIYIYTINNYILEYGQMCLGYTLHSPIGRGSLHLHPGESQITQIHSLLLDFGTLFSNALLFSWNFPRLRCGFSQRSPNMLIVLLLLYVCFISISSFSSFISFLFLLFNYFNCSNSLIG